MVEAAVHGFERLSRESARMDSAEAGMHSVLDVLASTLRGRNALVADAATGHSILRDRALVTGTGAMTDQWNAARQALEGHVATFDNALQDMPRILSAKTIAATRDEIVAHLDGMDRFARGDAPEFVFPRSDPGAANRHIIGDLRNYLHHEAGRVRHAAAHPDEPSIVLEHFAALAASAPS
jgi:hypothetical protein